MRRLLSAAALIATLSGCQDRVPAPAPAVPQALPPAQNVAFISVSDLWPAVGDTIVIAASTGDWMSVASFRVRLTYNVLALQYLDELPIPGALRVVNPQSNEIIVAGASTAASAGGRLFALRFRVRGDAGLESLALAVDELNDAAFASQLPTLKRSPHLVLDRKLAGPNPR